MLLLQRMVKSVRAYTQAPTVLFEIEGQSRPALPGVRLARGVLRAITILHQRMSECRRFDQIEDLGFDAAANIAFKPLTLEIDVLLPGFRPDTAGIDYEQTLPF